MGAFEDPSPGDPSQRRGRREGGFPGPPWQALEPAPGLAAAQAGLLSAGRAAAGDGARDGHRAPLCAAVPRGEQGQRRQSRVRGRGAAVGMGVWYPEMGCRDGKWLPGDGELVPRDGERDAGMGRGYLGMGSWYSERWGAGCRDGDQDLGMKAAAGRG